MFRISNFDIRIFSCESYCQTLCGDDQQCLAQCLTEPCDVPQFYTCMSQCQPCPHSCHLDSDCYEFLMEICVGGWCTIGGSAGSWEEIRAQIIAGIDPGADVKSPALTREEPMVAQPGKPEECGDPLRRQKQTR